MSAIQISRNQDHVLFHPDVHGFNASVTFWKRLAGAGDPTVASNHLRINAQTICSLSSYKYFQFRFRLSFPVEPTAGQDKFIGFISDPNTNHGKIGFLMSGTSFKVQAYDDNAQAIIDQAITFDSSWDAADTEYEITVDTKGIFFKIAGDVVAKADVAGYSVRGSTNKRVSTLPGFIYFKNGNADNMDLEFFVLKDIAHFN